jgi:hypothetical protein
VPPIIWKVLNHCQTKLSWKHDSDASRPHIKQKIQSPPKHVPVDDETKEMGETLTGVVQAETSPFLATHALHNIACMRIILHFTKATIRILPQ